MTTATAPRTPARSTGARVLTRLAVTACVAALIVGAWRAGVATAPTPADANSARSTAQLDASEAARSAALDSSYAAAWQPAFERGAAAGTREGTASGATAAKAG